VLASGAEFAVVGQFRAQVKEYRGESKDSGVILHRAAVMFHVYVACHINGKRPTVDYLRPLQTGAILKEHWGGFLRDDTNENISAKNRHYGEHTGLYWVWKNSRADIIGWCHYRRYFSPIEFPSNVPIVTLPTEEAQRILNLDQQGQLFDRALDYCDIILPRPFELGRSIADQYKYYHRAEDWQKMLQCLAELYSDEVDGASRFFESRTSIHACCMFVMGKQRFHDFCGWIFPLLLHIETLITPADDEYQGRVISYLAERLFNWWVFSRNLSVTYKPLILVE
jgi:hypothetical protein